MKNGMILFAAVLMAALVLSPAFAVQDTDLVNGTAAGSFGPGADVAVGSDGKLYVSYGNSTTINVFSGSAGADLSTQKITTTNDVTPDTVRLTAIGLTKQDTVVVVAFQGDQSGADTKVVLYYSTTGSNLTAIKTLTGLAGADNISQDSFLVTTGIDLVVDDSFIVIATTVGSNNATTAVDSSAATIIYVFQYDTSSQNPVLSHVTTLNRIGDSDVPDHGFARNVQLLLDPVEKNSTGTTAVWLVRTNTLDSVAGVDSGVYVSVLKIGAGGASRGQVISVSTIISGVGNDSSIGRISAQSTSSADTRSQITVSIADGDSPGSGKIWVYELGDSRTTNFRQTHSMLGRKAGNATPDTIVLAFDTGVSIGAVPSILTMSYGRVSDNHGWIIGVSAVDGNAGTTVIAVSQSSLGSGTFTADTAVTNAQIDRKSPFSGENFSSIVANSTFYTVGFDDGNNLVWVTRLFGSSESKKKDSGVCLFDRMFGRTSMAKAVFPGMKTFRDTLLGTDLGRKIVSLYYSF